ncbi:NAD-dependent protein deacylase [Salarchaeum sp. JOR-1]|uniref:NAD-dependent protein deacylase n=1 Tax=Salarchaeum sp. JOR-1 TaxID=2599399 RepID=UPI001198875F|nr:NAD-dependent protein deacylase [Salarchaeum sp. JOR-1]QDX40976.1 NAD-dependent protein deacylase [Salarchaeum sp. JOR-1]
MDDEAIARVAALVRDAETVSVLTGAGVSTASGIPSFRGEDGIWGEKFDPQDFHRRRFDRDPAGFWRDRLDLYDAMRPDGVEPNAAHRALADLEATGAIDGVITQNTDGLHQDAGSDRVIELHGNAERVACEECGRRSDAADARRRAADGELPPTCECGGVLKPDVVLFGEQLPANALHDARDLAERSGAFLAVGSSLTVDPAASLPATAARDGSLVVVNLDETRADELASVVLQADVTDALPAIAERVHEA